jgi:hypothetical protein
MPWACAIGIMAIKKPTTTRTRVKKLTRFGEKAISKLFAFISIVFCPALNERCFYQTFPEGQEQTRKVDQNVFKNIFRAGFDKKKPLGRGMSKRLIGQTSRCAFRL